MSTYQDALIEAAQGFHDHEMDVGGDARWERWLDKVVAILDLPIDRGLDGDEDEDGYCLDFALEACEAGTTPKAYAEHVRSKPQFRGAP